jgi:hypothetical protein
MNVACIQWLLSLIAKSYSQLLNHKTSRRASKWIKKCRKLLTKKTSTLNHSKTEGALIPTVTAVILSALCSMMANALGGMKQNDKCNNSRNNPSGKAALAQLPIQPNA